MGWTFFFFHYCLCAKHFGMIADHTYKGSLNEAVAALQSRDVEGTTFH